MKKTILIFLISFIQIFAQNESQNQSIELPDFVITGLQDVSVPEMEKPKPDLIVSLSEDFFKPKYLPDQLKLTSYSNPLRKDYDIFGKENYNNALLKLGAGINTLPTGHFYFSQSLDPFLFNSHVWGSNVKNYIKNSGYNVSGGSASADFFIGSKSSFLPGLKITAAGLFSRDSYKFFASDLPSTKRENEAYKVLFSASNNLSESIKYGASGSYDLLKFKDSDYKENLFSANGYFNISLNSIGILWNGEYQNHDPVNSLTSLNSAHYYSTNASVLIKSYSTFNLKLGVYYSQQDTTKLFSPVASFDMKLSNRLSIFAEYSPHTQFNKTSNLLYLNRYYLPVSRENITTKYNSEIKFAAKYEFYRYFEISAGASLAGIDNQFYFTDNDIKGIYNIASVDDVTGFTVFLNAFFHNGPLGYLYGEIKYNSLKTEDDYQIPFNPIYSTQVTYGFNLTDYLNFSTSLQYFGDSYSDQKNSNKLPNMINLGVMGKLEMFNNFKITVELENLLNRSNYIYSNYKEKPVDIIAGIEYRW
ncbi:MAG: hypothetical protein CVV23_04060 [Ignavibacteriae bacterium HGW-Ignavibacteriae-2]|jgi:hypothetical protein|nr:MAG: hypothetical protein CVV23_04060 [Ignavibacteriae bacterium HGW-Ignavibacteriae-2]